MASTDETPQSVPSNQDGQVFAAKAFTDLAGFVNVSMCVLGDRLGLFKDLAMNGPATSTDFAARTGIHERYAREWLSQMTCAEYVHYDSASQCFSLPDAHRSVLASEDHLDFLGGLYQGLQTIENGFFSKLLRAFRIGGGIPASEYSSDFWQGADRSSRTMYQHLLVQTYIPSVPDVLAALNRGVLVGDVGCGTGRALITLAQAFPKSRFIGYDMFEPNIAQAQANAQGAGVAERVQFMHHNASEGLAKTFDVLLTFDSLHHAVDTLQMLRSIRAALHPTGIYLCLEPKCAETLEGNIGMGGALLYGSSVLACVPQVLAEGEHALGAAGLSEVTLREYCRQAGFTRVYVPPLPQAPANLYEIRP